MANEAIALFVDRSEAVVLAAWESTARELGYAKARGPSDVEVTVVTSERGTCLRLDLTKSLGIALARRMTRKAARPVRLFSVRVDAKDEEEFECVLDDVTVAVDGSQRQGRWASDVTAAHDDDWSQIADGKSYFAATVLLADAMELVLGEEQDESTLHFSEPESLGVPRLDTIAHQARIAERAQLTAVAGRPCVRIMNTGATTTSFVSAGEAELLRSALGEILAS
ncbi:MAG: hypothetical protein U0234_21740 [Sandaracinus sp.]